MSDQEFNLEVKASPSSFSALMEGKYIKTGITCLAKAGLTHATLLADSEQFVFCGQDPAETLTARWDIDIEAFASYRCQGNIGLLLDFIEARKVMERTKGLTDLLIGYSTKRPGVHASFSDIEGIDKHFTITSEVWPDLEPLPILVNTDFSCKMEASALLELTQDLKIVAKEILLDPQKDCIRVTAKKSRRQNSFAGEIRLADPIISDLVVIREVKAKYSVNHLHALAGMHEFAHSISLVQGQIESGHEVLHLHWDLVPNMGTLDVMMGTPAVSSPFAKPDPDQSDIRGFCPEEGVDVK